MTENKSQLEGKALQDAIVKQIEYYFSKENLANDHYLVSQMDPQLWVPIATIAQFKMVRSLTTDKDLLVKGMRSIPTVEVDDAGQRIRPKIKAKRNTMILRDIPAATPVDQVKALFKDAKSTPHTVRGDFGDNWFIQFDNEDQTLQALEHLKTVKFQGAPVKARIKSENLLKSFYKGPRPDAQPFVPTGGAVYGAGAWIPPQGDQMYSGYPGGPHGGFAGYAPQGQFMGMPAGPPGPDGKGERVRGKKKGKGKGGAGEGQGNPAGAAGGNNADAQGNQKEGGKKKGKKAKKTGTQQHPILVVPSEATPVFTNEEFPALPGGFPGAPHLASGRDRARSVTGYQTQYTKYTRETILQVVKRTLANVSAPTNLSDTPVTRTEPDTKLEMEKPLPDPADLEALEEALRRRSQRLSSNDGSPARRRSTNSGRRTSSNMRASPGQPAHDDDDIIVEVSGVQAEPRRPAKTTTTTTTAAAAPAAKATSSSTSASKDKQTKQGETGGSTSSAGGKPTWAQMAANSKDKPAPPTTLGKKGGEGKEKEKVSGEEKAKK
eukprot:TRINITY_DN1713_c3_g1_i1.p1 TRINITY_DN1713_c3_g1~~TRINITY_DN1713_c3_g1_i1.p1  ORF type:complete len:548 (-),score=186.72 TRINITY_DN1713_c3_g1_i1:167-1810(-)